MLSNYTGPEVILSDSQDGSVTDFDFVNDHKFPLRFSARDLRIVKERSTDVRTQPPEQRTLNIRDWNDGVPTLNGKLIRRHADDETSYSLAINNSHDRFVLGSEWSLAAFDKSGRRLWLRAVPEEAIAVNITSDNRLIVAGYGDGTVRWHRLEDRKSTRLNSSHANISY